MLHHWWTSMKVPLSLIAIGLVVIGCGPAAGDVSKSEDKKIRDGLTTRLTDEEIRKLGIDPKGSGSNNPKTKDVTGNR